MYSGGGPSIETLLCRVCRMAPPPFHKVKAYGAYDREFRRLVHLFKYQGMTGLARPLGKLLAQAVAPLCEETPQKMLVIPVPLAREKQRERGYNQALLLAQSMVSELKKLTPEWKLSVADKLLQRSRSTESQARLTPHQRRRNLRGAFFAPKTEQLKGKSVLLIDDIYTTGATVRECTRALRKAGVASVWIGAFTRDQKEGVAFWQEKQGTIP